MDGHAARRHDLLASACTVKDSHSFESVQAVASALQPSYPVHCVRPELLEESARRFITLFPGPTFPLSSSQTRSTISFMTA